MCGYSRKQDVLISYGRFTHTLQVTYDTILVRSQIVSTADFPCDSDELTFMEFGRNLNEIHMADTHQ